MNRSKSLGAHESGVALEAFDSASVDEYQRQLTMFYFELHSAGRDRSTRKSSRTNKICESLLTRQFYSFSESAPALFQGRQRADQLAGEFA